MRVILCGHTPTDIMDRLIIEETDISEQKMW